MSSHSRHRRIAGFLALAIAFVLACDISTSSAPAAAPEAAGTQAALQLKATALALQLTQAAPGAPAQAQPQNPAAAASTPQNSAAGDQQYFTEEFQGDLKNWQTFIVDGRGPIITDQAPGKQDLSIQGGNYVFDLGSNIWAYSIYTPHEYNDVRVDARVVNQGTRNNGTSLVCRYSQGVGWYEFDITNSGLIWIGSVRPNSAGKLIGTKIVDGGSNNIKPVTNDYGIVCKGTVLTLYINGSIAKSTTDTEFYSGKIGVALSAPLTPAKVAFDWIKISKP